MKTWANFHPSPRLKMPGVKPVTLLEDVTGWTPSSCYSLFRCVQDCIDGRESRGVVGVNRQGHRIVILELSLDNLEHNIEVVDMLKAQKLFVSFTNRAYRSGLLLEQPTAVYFTEQPPFDGAEPIQLLED